MLTLPCLSPKLTLGSQGPFMVYRDAQPVAQNGTQMDRFRAGRGV